MATDDESTALAATSDGYLRALVDDQLAVRTTRDGIPLGQILADRPDVFAAYFQQFHSAGNDTHSTAWYDRVGGFGVEDYANYWYEHHGRWEGYGARGGDTAGAPTEDGAPRLLPGIEETGRTTSDGIPLSHILTDRPDVFRAFFTEFYGRNNDHNSSAWVDRVGGNTVEDYANYWYERHGKWGEYTPRAPDPVPSVDEEAPPADDEPVVVLPPDDEVPPPESAPWAGEIVDDGALSIGRSLCNAGDLGF
ncbi:MAG: hypothetical protein KKE02_18605 [Alphaproteobacteria bacterium]|nr:hypothetical protein [Alphaproteobacteria bacterium]MBU1512997.1 hypothetical protein [Alphaproteobacteria bacterium]MBU2095105.1 hypothetical protein [Alphaproteobacteria bacterium]MBU2153038.1 hypothetical protein [Alphaproteobacteria bacterium]MBU2365016.1 hypothetical protein [Alphaproteobacteria bacterium]